MEVKKPHRFPLLSYCIRLEKSVSTSPVNSSTLLTFPVLQTSRIIELGGVGIIGKVGENRLYGGVRWMGRASLSISLATLPSH
jgi:hypothetical protein